MMCSSALPNICICICAEYMCINHRAAEYVGRVTLGKTCVSTRIVYKKKAKRPIEFFITSINSFCQILNILHRGFVIITELQNLHVLTSPNVNWPLGFVSNPAGFNHRYRFLMRSWRTDRTRLIPHPGHGVGYWAINIVWGVGTYK